MECRNCVCCVSSFWCISHRCPSVFTHSSGVDSSTGRSHVVIHSKPIDEQYQGGRVEVCVSVQGHDICVFIRYMSPLAVIIMSRQEITLTI